MYREQDIINALIVRHGEKLQKKLKDARVAIAGLGGLGSNVAVNLARIGVGHLHLLDFDRVDLTNLNRQQYFLNQVGKYKTEALKEIIEQINPYIKIHLDCLKIDEENLCQLFMEDSIICEAFDDAEQKAMLVNGVLTHFPEKKLVAASGMAGYGESNAIHTRQIMGNFYLCGDEKTDIQTDGSLLAPRVALCAAHEANIITALIAEEMKYER